MATAGQPPAGARPPEKAAPSENAAGRPSEGPVSLEILVKVLAAAVVVTFTRRFGPEWAALGAVVGVLVPDGVRWLVGRRGWGWKRITFLTGLVTLFSRLDGLVGRAVRKTLGAAGDRLADAVLSALTSSQAAHTAATSVTALALTAGAAGTVKALPDRPVDAVVGSSQTFDLTAGQPRTVHVDATTGDRLVVQVRGADVEPHLNGGPGRRIEVTLVSPGGAELGGFGLTDFPPWDRYEPDDPLAADGTYALRIQTDPELRGSFAIGVYTAADPSPQSVVPTWEGVTLPLAFVAGQRATIRFHGEEGQRAVVRLSSTDITDFHASLRTISLTVRGPNGAELDGFGVSPTFDVFESDPLPRPGPYELVVDPLGALAGNATFILALR